MLYIAVVLVLVGILCFIYVSFNPGVSSGGKDEKASWHSKQTPPPPDYSQIPVSGNTLTSSYDDRILEERRVAPKSKKETFALHSREEAASSVVAKEEDSAGIMESVTTIPEEEVIPEVRFRLEGILYLDFSKKIAYDNRSLEDQNWKEEAFRAFRRMGPSILEENREGFVFHALNSQFRYNVDDIQKIVFYDEGFAFLPSKNQYPVAVFFTSETESLKSFLEQANKIDSD